MCQNKINFLNSQAKPGLNPIKAQTRIKFCFGLKFSVFRKFFPINIFWQNFWKNRKFFFNNPEIMDRKILVVKTEKKYLLCCQI